METTALVYSLLLSILSLVHQFQSVAGYTETVTGGGSGPQCPPGPQCLGGGQAACLNNKCKCQGPANQGLGHFLCHRPNEVYCAVYNDPVIKGFDGVSAMAPLNCKTKLTHISTPICNTDDPDNVVTNVAAGMCDVQVRAWGIRRRGKTFMNGFDVRFMVMYQGNYFHQMTRLFTVAENGEYIFNESTNHEIFGSPTDGPADNLTIPDLGRIYTVYNSRGDNFARIVAEMCGVEIGIRGVDFVRSPLETSAGVYIKVNTDCQPTYVSPEATLCSPPAGMGSSLSDHAQMLSQQTGQPVSVDVAIMHKALTDSTPQDFPGVAPSLQQLVDIATACPPQNIVDAIEKNSFIMQDINFLRCFDQTVNLETAIDAFGMGLFSVCDNNNKKFCKQVQEQVVNSTCLLKSAMGTLMLEDCGFEFNIESIIVPQ